MTAWKRWSWRYRIGALFALSLLLQGSYCPIFFQDMSKSTNVPGIPGNVHPERQVSADGRHYYGIYDPNGRQRVVYEGSREYELIDQYFNPPHPVGFGGRSTIPGAAGSLPAPPVQ